jgi:VIT1/CCC1 family predicted Fe2+/Mn2+ transporter
MQQKNDNSTAQESNSTFADYFKEIIYGGIDGIVTTFAVVAGFSGAALASDTTLQVSFVVVLLFGLANLFADAASMGLGNFLSVRSEKDLYQAKRAQAVRGIEADPEQARNNAKQVLQEKGFSAQEADMLATTYASNQEYLVDFILQHQLELSDPRGEREIFTGLATFFSFMLFGAIPLLPFMLQAEGDARTTFIFSAMGTFAALVALGLLKWRVIGTRFLPSLFEVVVVGSVAAVLAFYVGTFFSVESASIAVDFYESFL